MTGPTHRQYSLTFALITSIVLYKNELTQVNYYMALPILIMAAKSGALFPDIDHSWQYVKEKTAINWVINKAIHLTRGRHRSWQTHSIDIVAVLSIISYFLPDILFKMGKLSTTNREILSILLMGFMSGWTSHIISDMMTSAGVRLLCFRDYKVAFVPKRIGRFRFNTGNEWESFNYMVMKGLNLVLGAIAIIYPAIHSGSLDRTIESIKSFVGGV